MSKKWRRRALMRETLALSGDNHHPTRQTLAPLGLLQPAMCAKQAQHTAIYSKNVQPVLGGILSIKAIVPSAEADPHRSNLCQNVLMRASFFFSMQGLVITLSYLYHRSHHLMGSSAPWRSELIISPCAPILWYLSIGYGPAHQRLRPPWSHQS
jgi:hypothetical protein